VVFAGDESNFELNAMQRIIIIDLPHSATIVADGCRKFRRFSVEHKARLQQG
jgi:fumarate hydratase class II